MIKVLHVYPKLLCGGVEKVIENICLFSDPEQYAFEILTQEEGEQDEVFAQLGVKIHRIPFTGDEHAYREKVARLLEQGGYDAVHCHSHREMSLVNLEARRAGISVRIAHCHNAHQDITGPRRWGRILKFHRHTRGATDLIGCSRDAYDWMFPLRHGRRRIITNGIDARRFAFSPTARHEKRAEIRHLLAEQSANQNDQETLPLTDATTIVMTTGRASHQKNHRLILEMASLSKGIDRLFVIIGDGPLLTELKKEAAQRRLSNILFLGTRRNIEEWLCAADIFVFPSRFEGHPLAPMEAQASGLPVVVSQMMPEETRMKDAIYLKAPIKKASDWVDIITRLERQLDKSDKARKERSLHCIAFNEDKDVRHITDNFLRLYAPARILFCHVAPPKGITGGERYDARFAECLQQASGVPATQYVIQGSSSASEAPRSIPKWWLPIKAITDLRQILRNQRRRGNRPMTLVFNTSKSLYFLPALTMLKLRGIKTVGITHHPLYIQMKGWKRKVYEWAELTFIGKLDFRVAASDYTRRLLSGRLPGKEVNLIPIPFDKGRNEAELLNFNTLGEENRENFAEFSNFFEENWEKIGKFAGEKTELLFIGTIEPRKGLDHLLSTMTILKRSNIKVRLTVAGKATDKDYDRRLRSQASAEGLDIDWLGYVDEERKRSLLKKADIFVLPSGAEGFGIVLVEAMQVATPVVAFRNSGMIDVVGPDNERGLLASDGDPESLAEAIMQLINNPDLRTEKVKAALEWTASLPSSIDFYRDINSLCGRILQ